MNMKNTTDIIDEVKQDITNERTMRIIRNYGKHIITAIVIFIVAFSIYIYMGDRVVDKQKALAEEYQNIFLNSPPSIEKQTVIENYIKKTEDNIFEYLATFQYAHMLAKNNQATKSIEMLLALAVKNKFVEMSNLALVQASEIIIEQSAANHRDKTIALLSSKIEDNNSKTPHFYIMQIMLAQLLIDKGELKAAQALLKKMDNSNMLPPNIKLLRNMLSNTIFTKNHE